MDTTPTSRFRLGPYEPLLELASGGMATVYVARQVGAAGFERLVVLKRVHAHLLADHEFTNMFRDEARLASLIRHPNVVSVIDVVESERELFLVMDYVESTAVSSLMRRVRSADARLPPPVAARIVADALAGLHAAHEAVDLKGEKLDVVHRDVSPQNVIVGVDGASRLIDFGIAKAAHRIAETRSGSLKGKLGYMAPEGVEGRPVDRRADIFATGVVLFEAMTTVRLFAGENDLDTLRRISDCRVPDVSSIVAGLPQGLDALVHRALAKDPAERFQTAQEFLEALERVVPLAPPRDVAAALEEYCGAALAERRAELRSRLEGRTGPVRLPASRGAPPAGPIAEGGETLIEGTDHRLATANDAPPRGRGARAFLTGGLLATALLVGLVAATWLRSTSAKDRSPALASTDSAAAVAVAPKAPSSAPTASAEQDAAAVELVIVSEAPIDTVRAKGMREVHLDGGRARLVLSPWQGELPIDVAIVGGGSSRLVALAGGPRELHLEADPKKGKLRRAPSAAPPAASAPKPHELQENPYGQQP